MEEIMTEINPVLAAIEMLSNIDVPDENLGAMLTAQAKVQSGMSVDDAWYGDPEATIH
jgi:hypothetical protein